MNKLGICLLSILIMALLNPPDPVRGHDEGKRVSLRKKSGTVTIQKELLPYKAAPELKFLTITSKFIAAEQDQEHDLYSDENFTNSLFSLNNKQLSSQYLDGMSIQPKSDKTDNHFWSDYYSRGITLINRNIVMLRRFKLSIKDFSDQSGVLEISMKWE